MAPDLRGHGDSQWSADGSYTMAGYVYDLAQLVHQQKLAPVTIIAHSLGGNVALRYAGIYPESVSALVAIEGLGPSPTALAARRQKTIAERMDEWIGEQRGLAGRLPRRYATIEDAFRRMQEENPHLSAEQARHLTAHGVNQNEDGTYSWKFDNYVRAWPPYDMAGRDIQALWARIACPTLLLYGTESRSGNPADRRPRRPLPARHRHRHRPRRPLAPPRPPRRVPPDRARLPVQSLTPSPLIAVTPAVVAGRTHRPARTPSWRAVVAVTSAGLGERAANNSKCPAPDPLWGMGGPSEPSPERVTATGEPCGRARGLCVRPAATADATGRLRELATAAWTRRCRTGGLRRTRSRAGTSGRAGRRSRG